MKMCRILVIDDDSESCELLTGCFKAERFETTSVRDGGHGLKLAASAADQYDLIVLSVTLSGISAFEVLKSLRPQFDTPVVMLTTRDKKVDGIIGLEMGADAFMLKPFNPRELVAYARAILRRTKDHHRRTFIPERISVGDIELDTVTRVAHRCGERLNLTSVEFGFLEMLLRSAGQVITSEQLAEGVLGRTLSAYDRSVSVHVGNLRKKLGHRLGEIERIITVRGQGYIYANPQEHNFMSH
ncbi:MAG: response regulator transcription factor [Deltaproteobacteria bacterium]|jgi:two-component system response regulator CpxR|nr:response regulator transcription factor [Deltaproteobacteria bacterium]